MKREDKSAGEQCREDIVDCLGTWYPVRVQRADIISAAVSGAWGWSVAQVDSALYKLKKDGIITKDDDGYQLRTAPESCTARMVAERNASGEKTPSTMDEKPTHAALGKPVMPPPTPVAEPVPINPNGFTDDDGAFCKGCGQAPNECVCKPLPDELDQLDPVAVRTALGELQERLTAPRVDISDKALKLEVLDHLGRILDDSIEAVLVSIAGDIKDR